MAADETHRLLLEIEAKVDRAVHALQDMGASVQKMADQTEQASTRVTRSTEKMGLGFQDAMRQIDGAISKGMTLWLLFDRIQGTQIRVARSTKELNAANFALQKAQEDVNKALAIGGKGSAEYKTAVDKLKLAQERQNVAIMRLRDAQEDLKRVQVMTAVTAIPQLISGLGLLIAAHWGHTAAASAGTVAATGFRTAIGDITAIVSVVGAIAAVTVALGAVTKKYEDATYVVDEFAESMEESSAAVLTAAEEAYVAEYKAFLEKWDKMLEGTETALDKLLGKWNRYYDDLVADTRRGLDDTLREIDHFYDELLAIEKEKLETIREGRDDELDALEKAYLEQTAILKTQFEEGEKGWIEYEFELKKLTEEYEQKRKEIRDIWRIKEIDAEEEFERESIDIEERRQSAIEQAVEAANIRIAELEDERIIKLESIKAEEYAINVKYWGDVEEGYEGFYDRLIAKQEEALNKMVHNWEAAQEKMKPPEVPAPAVAPPAVTPAPARALPPYLPPTFVPPPKPIQIAADMLVEAGKQIGKALTDWWKGLTGERRYRGYQYGGPVYRTGLAFLHAGEYVLPRGAPTQITFSAPLLVIEGSADRRTAEYAVARMKRMLQSVIVEPTSASATTKRIRMR